MKSLPNFTSGGKVMWRVVSLGRDGEIKYRLPESREPLLWLGQRSPPPAENVHALRFDMTNRLRKGMMLGQPTFTFLYDNRFAIRFLLEGRQYVKDTQRMWSLTEMLQEGKIVVRPETRLYLPEVVWERSGEEDRLLGCYAPTKESPIPEWTSIPWIDAYFVRPLSML